MKLGMVGTINDSGLGVLAKQFHKFMDVGVHCVAPHPSKGTHVEAINSDYIMSPKWDISNTMVEEFIGRKPTVVLFFEYPYNWDLVKRLHKEGIPIVWIPMLDSVGTPWLRKEGVIDLINLFIAPTKYSHSILENEGLPSIHIPWPIDTEYFKFSQRGTEDTITFVHNVGYGGDGNRKGWDLVLRAWGQVKKSGHKLIMHSQVKIGGRNFKVPGKWLEGIDFRFGNLKEAYDLYDEGDIYISPSRKEGLGLPFREAMSCGMPTIGTDIPPINEVIDDPNLLVKYVGKREIGKVQNGWVYEPDLEDLVNKMNRIIEMDIRNKSQEVRQKIENEFSWHVLQEVYQVVFEEMSL